MVIGSSLARVTPCGERLRAATIVCVVATIACGSGDDATVPVPDARSDQTVTPVDAGADSNGGASDGLEENLQDDATDGAPRSDDAGADDADADAGQGRVVGDEEWLLTPLPWDACAVFDAGALDEASVTAGMAAVDYYGCATCHGYTLDDAGKPVVSLDGHRLAPGIYPPNLTNSPDGLGCWTNTEIARAILFGVARDGTNLCPPMPVWSSVGMEAGTASAIVDFLRSLPASERRVADTTCPSGVDGGPSDGAASE